MGSSGTPKPWARCGSRRRSAAAGARAPMVDVESAGSAKGDGGHVTCLHAFKRALPICRYMCIYIYIYIHVYVCMCRSIHAHADAYGWHIVANAQSPCPWSDGARVAFSPVINANSTAASSGSHHEPVYVHANSFM